MHKQTITVTISPGESADPGAILMAALRDEAIHEFAILRGTKQVAGFTRELATNQRREPKAREAATPTKPRTTNAGEINTRTAEGRAAYDAAILDALRQLGRPAAAPEIIAITGGTPLQARTALNRLIEDRKVAWTGKARGTRYTAK